MVRRANASYRSAARPDAVPAISQPAVCGRFAPTPSGPLHLGSLVAAVGSYLAARSAGGRWLVRIEDVDTARAVPGAADELLQTLARHGLESDGPVRFQSTRTEHYRSALRTLIARDGVYPCTCSRRDVARAGVAGTDGYIYPGTCRAGPTPGRPVHSWRLRAGSTGMGFTDAIHGYVHQDLQQTTGDCVIWRTDDMAAYHLAVVVDDLDQGVTQVVRGGDLLFATGAQMRLAGLLNAAPPTYGHLPLILAPDGRKLAKSAASPGIDPDRPQENLACALTALGHAPPTGLRGAPTAELLSWACAAFDLGRVPKRPYAAC